MWLSCARVPSADCARANQFSITYIVETALIHCLSQSSICDRYFVTYPGWHAINCQSQCCVQSAKEKHWNESLSFDEFGIWFGLVGANWLVYLVWLADCCFCYTCFSSVRSNWAYNCACNVVIFVDKTKQRALFILEYVADRGQCLRIAQFTMSKYSWGDYGWLVQFF